MCASASLHLFFLMTPHAPLLSRQPPRSPLDTPIELEVGELAPARAATDPTPSLESTPSVVAADGEGHQGRTERRVAAPPRKPRPRATPATPALPKRANAAQTDAGAIDRTLRRIAATTQLSVTARRRAMLVVLRTWEDPSIAPAAERLVDRLLYESQNESSLTDR